MDGLTRFDGMPGVPLGVYRSFGIGAFDPHDIGIATFAWGDPAVTRLRRQADKSVNYQVGVNTPTTLEHVGLIKRLRLVNSLNVTLVQGTGAAARDSFGPFNLFSNILIRVSGLDLLYQVSGWGAYLINLINYPVSASPDSPGVTSSNATAVAAGVFNFPASPAAGATLLFSLDLPFTAPLLGYEDLGLWLIQNETVNMEVVPTYAALGGANRLLQPYVLTGTASATVNSGSTAIWREFYGVPARAEDMPPLGYVHQWEEQYDALTGTQLDIFHQRGGILLRLAYQIVDADSAGDGTNVANGLSLGNLSGLEFKYDANDTPFDEDQSSILARQREFYGKDLPLGAYSHDLFTETKTLQDSYNTENYINIKTRFRFAKTMVAGSNIRTIRERLLPVVVNTAQG